MFRVAVRPLVEYVATATTAAQPRLATVIAFGQTGAGKTHTQTAVQERAVTELIALCPPGCVVRVSFYENAGTRLFDLLAERRELQLRTGVLAGEATERCHVVGVREVPCTSADEALPLLRQAAALRRSQPTARNPESSRSHAICTLSLARSTDGAGEDPNPLVGALRIVDLAGSERREDALAHNLERIAEMKEINWSLGCLKECIRGLFVRESTNPLEHIKFRNSKLTTLLRDLFEGDESRCVFIACVSPMLRDWHHTRSTLGYSAQLKDVDLLQAGRIATPEELREELLQFYVERAPRNATLEKVCSVLADWAGRERDLYARMKRRYRDAPAALLRAQPATDASKVDQPLKWNRKEVQAFVQSVIGGEYAQRFNLTGSQLFMLDVNGVMRRCGGRWSCAAFSARFEAEAAELDPMEQERQRVAAEAAEEAGRCLFAAFAARVRAVRRG